MEDRPLEDPLDLNHSVLQVHQLEDHPSAVHPHPVAHTEDDHLMVVLPVEDRLPEDHPLEDLHLVLLLEYQ